MKTEKRKCNRCVKEFILEQDDFSFYEKMKVPIPDICPDCRFQMRAIWRNETNLYSGRKCDMCKKNIITMYSPKSPYPIYCYDCYFSDRWDSKNYFRDYDRSRPFIDQMEELLLRVPKINLYSSSNEGAIINSEYINYAGACKNCYLVFNTSSAEDLMYSRGCRRNCSDSSDLYFCLNSSFCYEGINVNNSSNVVWGKNVSNSIDSCFLLNCSNINNCFGCVNLRNKSNYFLNKKLTFEEYRKKINEIRGSYKRIEEFKNEFEKFLKKFPQRENNNLKTIDSTGNYLLECKNVKESKEVNNSENCKYLFSNLEIKDSMDCFGFGKKSELLLNTVGVGSSSNVIGSIGVELSQNILYSFFVKNSRDCLGCDSLKNCQYCILNKQYTKDEYEELKNYIIEEFKKEQTHGMILSPNISTFSYNETMAQTFFPITKEEALKQGFRWEDDIQKTEGKETLQPEDIPDHIKDVDDSITDEVLKCIDCKRNYKITDQELLFYRKMILPIPRKCFYCRHEDRIRRRGSLRFFYRKCSNCDKNCYTNLTEETAPIMYCEKCYQQEVI